MFSLARPVVRFRPASKRSLSSPAITNVLIPRRSALSVGPLIVPRRTTFSSDSPPLVVTVWARGVASARTTARAIRDESRMLPPSDRMPERDLQLAHDREAGAVRERQNACPYAHVRRPREESTADVSH